MKRHLGARVTQLHHDYCSDAGMQVVEWISWAALGVAWLLSLQR